MGLDDALRNARHQADWRAKQARAEQERKTALEQKVHSMLHEALLHLRPYGSETFVQAKRISGGRGARYRVLSRRRCWVITQMEGKSGANRTGPWMKSPVLLLEDGTGGRFWLNPELEGANGPGEYISTYAHDPLTGPNIFITHHSDDQIEVLEQHLAHAIVKYERQG